MHRPVALGEGAQGEHPAREAVRRLGRVAAGHAQQHEQAGADARDLVPLHPDGRPGHALDQRAHYSRAGARSGWATPLASATLRFSRLITSAARPAYAARSRSRYAR